MQQEGARGAAPAADQGEYAAARAQLEASIRSGSAGDDKRAALLRLLRETGQYGEAERRAGEFRAASGDAPVILLESGRIAAEQGKRARAEEDLRKTAESRRGAPPDVVLAAMRELGLLLADSGREAEAQAIWQGVLERYRAGSLRGSLQLGCAAVAAWQLGLFRQAQSLFADATAQAEAGTADLDALTDFGYLLLEKYNAQDAISVFKDCLAIRKGYPRALMGMALARRYDDAGEAEKYARAALSMNPSCVPALVFLAQLSLREEAPAEAATLVRQALGVHEADLEALSLKAVCHLMAKEAREYEETEKRILALHPAFGRLYLVLAEHQVMQRKYFEAVAYARRAVALDPKLWEAHATLGMNLMRVADLKGGRAALETAFQGDPYHVWAYNTLGLLDQMEKFGRTSSRHFVFLMSGEDAPALETALAQLAEEAYAALTKKYEFVPQGPIQVEVFPDHAGFAVRTLGLPGLGALGVCFGTVVAIDSPRARPAEAFNWGSTLWHELAHVITLQMTRHNIPRWLSEGISVYEERRARQGWGDDLTPSFVRAYKEGRLLKASELNAGMMRPRYREEIGFSYYQASLVCELIEEKFGFGALPKMLRLYAGELATAEVLRQALGWDIQTLDREYARYLEGRLKNAARVLRFDRAHGGEQNPEEARKSYEARLAGDAEDFMALLGLGALLREENPGEAERLLKKAQQVFPEYVGAGNPYELLSSIYQKQGRKDLEAAELEGWTRYDENALAPLVRAAEIYSTSNDWNGVIRALDRARFIYPYDAPLHLKLGEAAENTKRWELAALAYGVAARMGGTDPAEAHFRLARILHAQGKNDEARREVLRALEIAPSYEKALGLLLKVTGREP